MSDLRVEDNGMVSDATHDGNYEETKQGTCGEI